MFNIFWLIKSQHEGKIVNIITFYYKSIRKNKTQEKNVLLDLSIV